MFFKSKKYKDRCIDLICSASSVGRKNALLYFNHMKSLDEYTFNYQVGHPEEDVILSYISVYNEMVHIYKAFEIGERFDTNLAKSGELTLLSIVAMAYYAGKKIPEDPQFKPYAPKEFPERFSDFCSVKLPTVSSGLVAINVWMDELPQSETLGIAFL